MKKILLLLLLLLFLPFTSMAAFYKCANENGTIEFRDSPCINGADITPDSLKVMKKIEPRQPTKKYKGKTITLKFKQIDVKNIFNLLAKVSEKKLAMKPNVSNCIIDVNAVDEPWDKVLNEVSKICNLRVKVYSNVIEVKK